MPWFNPYQSSTGDSLSVLQYALRFPAWVLWQLWGFVVSWSETRQIRPLIQGVPALVLAGLLIVLLLRQGQPASTDLVARYQEQARRAINDEEFSLADFYFRKLEQLAPGDLRIRFDHALMYEAQGGYLQAASMMESLLRDHSGADDVKIHRWLAKAAMAGRLEVEDPLAYAKVHLNKVLQIQPDDREAHFFYSKLCLQQNDLENAIKHLEPIATRSPEIQMHLATLYGLRGDRTRLRTLAQEAARTLQSEVELRQSTDVTVWLQLAGAHLLLEDYEQAVNVLKSAVTKFNDDTCRKSLGRIYVRWSDSVAAQSPEDIGRQMQLLQEALNYAPDDVVALQRIVEIAQTQGPEAEKAKTRLKEALADGRAAGVIHFALGTFEASAGNMDAALRHLDQAYAINPKTAVMLNNLAFVLSKVDPPDLDRALEMSNQALRIAPEVAPFRETRGQILTAQAQYAEAITDLEYALPRIPRKPTQMAIHRALATCYEKLGDAELARIHAERAQKLEVELAAKAPVPAPVEEPTAPLIPPGDADGAVSNEAVINDDVAQPSEGLPVE